MTIVWSLSIVRIDCNYIEIAAILGMLLKLLGVLYSAGILKLLKIQIFIQHS